MPKKIAADIVQAMLERARQQVKDGLASEMGTKYWRVADEALRLVESHQNDIVDYGWREFTQTLHALEHTPAKEQRFIVQMTADELIQDMLHGAATLNEDTIARQARLEKVKQILVELGSIGAKILIALL